MQKAYAISKPLQRLPVQAPSVSALLTGSDFNRCGHAGRSGMAVKFGIESTSEARAYWRHEILCNRLKECVAFILAVRGKSISDLRNSFPPMATQIPPPVATSNSPTLSAVQRWVDRPRLAASVSTRQDVTFNPLTHEGKLD